MMRRKELTNLLNEKTERVLVLETKLESLRQKLDSYRDREQAIVASFSAAHAAAERQLSEADQRVKTLIGQAEEKARQTLQEAERKAGTALNNADAQAKAVIDSAKAHADSLTVDAKNRCTAMLAKAEEEQAACQENIRRLNVLLKQNASAALAAAEQYAALCGKSQGEYTRVDQPEEAEAVPFAADPQASKAAVLPDPSSSPARLMQNIYELQNRDIPAPVHEGPAGGPTYPQDVPDPDPAAVEEELPDFAAKPEDAYDGEDASAAGAAYVPEADWQPEEDQTAPTVNELLPDDDQVAQSLDALLDEIIRAGE